MPGESSRRRLTQAEAAFLYAETPQTPMHVGGCGLYAGRLSKDTLCDLIASRLDRLPQYRRKAVFAPLNLAHPTWEDDPDFDLSRHIDEIELPPPADDRVISRVCGQLFSAPLDRDQPLWKLTLIHGRPDGESMVLARVHQAMLEGVSGIDLMLTLHDFRSQPTLGTPGTWRPEATPDALSLLQEAVRDRITEVVQWWTDNSFQFFRSPNQTSYAKRVVNGCLSLSTTLLHPTPGTPFNADLSGRRELVWLELSFADARFIRSVLRGNVDDVVLALIAGGIGRYLRSKGVDTDGLELRAALPVNLKRHEPRHRRGARAGDRTSTMLVPLYVGITDPLLRFSAHQAAVVELREQDQAGTFHALKHLTTCIPPAWQAVAGRPISAGTLANTVVMNVPGPQIPLYLAGHKRHAFFPMGPLGGRVGLFHAVASYNKKLSIGVTLDPHLVPDGHAYVGCLRESYRELHGAAVKFSRRSTRGRTASPAAHTHAA